MGGNDQRLRRSAHIKVWEVGPTYYATELEDGLHRRSMPCRCHTFLPTRWKAASINFQTPSRLGPLRPIHIGRSHRISRVPQRRSCQDSVRILYLRTMGFGTIANPDSADVWNSANRYFCADRRLTAAFSRWYAAIPSIKWFTRPFPTQCTMPKAQVGMY